ncbi:hypothetical protein [Sulfoacidibacillus thermotolerans]|uniref:Glycoside hydrolase family 42 N-terminal domain-containing protein n=1 Tax=Sulfoacidibacillus thermotolerans TaxID=1765684 RepID=A0A2U3D0V6_SULT2|nr:hypothetical protein [Sulfoacidibacillus thermotolerans]PWI54884.1 hypothetical protein BM613_13500 [Sulfoacidibacillus thermotolerans]
MRFAKKLWLLIGLSAISVTTSGVPSHSAFAATSKVSKPSWIIAQSAVMKLHTTSHWSLVQQMLDQPSTILITGRKPEPKWLANWRVRRYLDATSLLLVQEDVQYAKSHKNITGIVLDLEHWSFTPISEQINFVQTLRETENFARQQHLNVLFTPATDLARALYPHGRIDSQYITLRIPANSAHIVNQFEIQAQGVESTPAAYLNFIQESVQQIRSVHSSIPVFAGLSSAPSGQNVSANTLLLDEQITMKWVQGYWLNIPERGAACSRCKESRPEVIADFLTLLSRKETPHSQSAKRSIPHDPVKPFLIYYGWIPENQHRLLKFSRTIQGYSAVVLGSGDEWSQNNEIHSIQKLESWLPQIRWYGYISIGVTNGEPHHTDEQIEREIVLWKKLHVSGILLDCAGPSYGVDAARRTFALNEVHRAKLHALVNVYTPSVLLSLHPMKGDAWLAENWVISNGRSGINPEQEWWAIPKIKQHGWGIWMTATGTHAPQNRNTVRQWVYDTTKKVKGTMIAIAGENYSSQSNWVVPASWI